MIASDAARTNPTATTLAWFREQIAVPPWHQDLMVDGRSIHYRSWGSAGRAQIVLVHGGAANSAWWDHVAPSLSRFGQVHAIDLGGHGQSDWARDYTLRGWAREVAALIDRVSATGDRVVLIGHSRGGFVALLAIAECRADVDGLVLVETAFDVDPPPVARATTTESSAAGRPPSREQMIARFRPHPRDVPVEDYVLAHVAEQSIVESEGRWRWQFDRAFLGRVKAMRIEQLEPIAVPLLQVRGSVGLLTAETADAARAVLSPGSEIVVVDRAGHHIMLQRPRELVSCLRAALASWLDVPVR